MKYSIKQLNIFISRVVESIKRFNIFEFIKNNRMVCGLILFAILGAVLYSFFVVTGLAINESVPLLLGNDPTRVTRVDPSVLKSTQHFNELARLNHPIGYVLISLDDPFSWYSFAVILTVGVVILGVAVGSIYFDVS